MRLEEYWGVGPKTAALLEAELGTEAAVEAIEAADSHALVEAGLPRGRATRILRHAHGTSGMAALATGDTRSVYKDLVALLEGFALTRRAADRIRVLTPLSSRDAMEARLDDVMEAAASWRALDAETRGAVVSAFEAHDSVAGGERSAVEAALALREAGVSGDAFADVAALDADRLREAADALARLDGDAVAEGADDRLDDLRGALDAVEDMEGSAMDVIETVRSGGVRDTDEFREAFAAHVRRETGISAERLRAAMPEDALDAADFVSGTLRALADDLRADLDERQAAVAGDLRETVEAARDEIDAAVSAVDDVAFLLSLARFAAEFDCSRPEFAEDALAIEGARNLSLLDAGEDVQPVTYALGDHDLDAPAGDRVSVLTGANSGGKTTLLETLCQVELLAMMGLPVPAERAVASPVDAVVFHRRHASFNAGVLESTLRTVVPPLARPGRTLMLVDEFEAITEPGSAADLLHGLVTLTVDRDALGAFVTHLADDLKPLPDAARIDGIFARGLDADLELEVDYQPRFGELGRSTPEFIVSRLIADASERAERAGYEALADALGQEVVQRTLDDTRWSGFVGE